MGGVDNRTQAAAGGGSGVAGDALGGLAATLVALPSAVAFGLTVYAPLGQSIGAQGALAGMIGTVILGLVAPLIGGTARLITAPCAPAAAVLAGVATQLAGSPPAEAMLLLSLVGLVAGALQLLVGFLGGGRLIKFIPYPVVAGYLSGVGLLIMVKQLPKFLGVPGDLGFWQALGAPAAWNLPGVAVGTVTVLAMIGSMRWLKRVPAAIVALLAGIGAYFVTAAFVPGLLSVTGNPLVIGRLDGAGLGDLIGQIAGRWQSLPALGVGRLTAVLVPAATLAVLLAIDTLKTCVIVDSMTNSRHNSDRELRGQGAANLLAGLLGGMAGAGTMGATLVNISSGGHSRWSGVYAGVFAGLVLAVLGGLVAWIPVPALAGILLVIAFRMIDRGSFRLLRQRGTLLDFAVIAAVVATAVSSNLIAAAGVGLGLAIVLFIREQIRTSVVRRLTFGNLIRSKRRRLPAEQQALAVSGESIVVAEVQGALFFGTTDQLMTLLEPHLGRARFVILDLRRVQTVDFTAAHRLQGLDARLAAQGGGLLLSHIPATLPTGQDLNLYLRQLGVAGADRTLRIFAELDAALEWAETRLLVDQGVVAADGGRIAPLALSEVDVLRALDGPALELLQQSVAKRGFADGSRIFGRGDRGDELYLVAAGEVRIELPIPGRGPHHLVTVGRGDFFGDMAFLDREARSADAVAVGEVLLFELSRTAFDRAAAREPRAGQQLFAGLARVLASRLRHADLEIRALEEA